MHLPVDTGKYNLLYTKCILYFPRTIFIMDKCKLMYSMSIA